MSRYNRERDYYQAVCNLCAAQCRSLLASRGIRAMVTNRSKEPSSLEQKLRKRLSQASGKDPDTAYRDIVDLAGVRIAVYFPGNLAEVENLICESFDVEQRKQFPQESPIDRPPFGYSAVHYHVRLRHGSPGDSERRYSEALVEIQIASVLMHAWAEVEHDLAYKPSTGELSSDEREILNQLNALVIAGETALRHLQQALERRIKGAETQFRNHYDMSAYLYDELKRRRAPGAMEPRMGRVDVLFEFLRLSKLDSPRYLGEFVDGLDDDSGANTVAQQIVDHILRRGEVEGALDLYRQAQSAAESRLPSFVFSASRSELAADSVRFIPLWSTFERRLRDWAQGQGYDAEPARFRVRSALNRLAAGNEVLRRELEYALRIRNEVVHGVEQPDAAQLDRVVSAVDEALQLLDRCDSEES